jgi:hypothetical protein
VAATVNGAGLIGGGRRRDRIIVPAIAVGKRPGLTDRMRDRRSANQISPQVRRPGHRDEARYIGWVDGQWCRRVLCSAPGNRQRRRDRAGPLATGVTV